MILTDTHTHLYLDEFNAHRVDVMQRALEEGVSRLFLPNIEAASISQVFELCVAYPDNCYPMLGLHPCSVKANYKQELEQIEQAIQSNKIFAIGEIGIDLYWDKTSLKEQEEAFITQINWAKDMQLPISIHCRDAYPEVLAILEQEKDEKLRGVLHCFGGSFEDANRLIDLGFYLGIGGVVTYKNSGLDKVVEQIPLAHLLLETDAPYLSPVPHRGKSNESSFLVYIAQKVADLHQTSIEEVATITTRNSIQLFGV